MDAREQRGLEIAARSKIERRGDYWIVPSQTLSGSYQVTMDDSATWTTPWTALIRMKKTDEAVYEYACHEGNYGMEGILGGHRAEERAAAEAAKSGSP